MIDLVGGIYRAGVHEGLMNVKEKVSEARAKGLNLIEVLKSLEPTPEEKAEARMYKKLYLPNLNLTERRRKTRAEVILAQEIHQEINQAVREQAARVFARGAEILKDIGASPEDIAKFLAIYPPQDNKS